MNKKIRGFFLKIFISFFAIVSAFLSRSFWGNPLNLKEVEIGSRKVLKNVLSSSVVNIANADEIVMGTCGSGDISGGGDSCGGDGGGGGDSGGDSG